MAGRSPAVSPAVESQISSLRGGGQPLTPSVRAFFESRFGHDFGYVRLHTDSLAAQLTQSLNARGFTVGHDVVLGAGQYSAQTFEGKKLIAHELTHVLQQSNAKPLIFRKIQFNNPKYFKKNPIPKILSGATRLGFTKPTFNNKSLTSDFKYNRNLIIKALAPKRLNYDPLTKECTFSDFDVTVSANVYIPTEPKGDNWNMSLLGSEIKKVPNCHQAGYKTVFMIGSPSSKAIYELIKNNEQEHINDLKHLYNEHLEKHFTWLFSLKENGTDGGKCTQNLVGALGKQDSHVADEFLRKWVKLTNARMPKVITISRV
jgi:hypothetical protein